jgi:hypothetical protein
VHAVESHLRGADEILPVNLVPPSSVVPTILPSLLRITEASGKPPSEPLNPKLCETTPSRAQREEAAIREGGAFKIRVPEVAMEAKNKEGISETPSSFVKGGNA